MGDPWEDYEEALARIELLEAEVERLREIINSYCDPFDMKDEDVDYLGWWDKEQSSEIQLRVMKKAAKRLSARFGKEFIIDERKLTEFGSSKKENKDD